MPRSSFALATLAVALLLLSLLPRPSAQRQPPPHATLPSEEEKARFFFACSGGEEDAARRMLKEKPGLARASTEDGETGLHLVSISGSVGVARALLDAAADANVRTTFDGGLRMHPLSWNVYAGHVEIAELLLDHGARINDDFDLKAGSDEKVTALDIAEMLADGRADSPDPDKFERTYRMLLKRGGRRYRELHPPEEEEKRDEL